MLGILILLFIFAIIISICCASAYQSGKRDGYANGKSDGLLSYENHLKEMEKIKQEAMKKIKELAEKRNNKQ